MPPIIKQLGLRDRVNARIAPTGSQSTDLDLGQVIQVLVCNRLLAPKPLVHVETWLGQTALPDLLGIRADQCNDDRLARGLDALVPHRDALWQNLIVGAMPSAPSISTSQSASSRSCSAPWLRSWSTPCWNC
ncbi:MAG: DUF4277 domain-containing protein [Chloroflexi bacterium]|nr:DUF4277 domain-containing protein [Chloroflexota bacterium]